MEWTSRSGIILKEIQKTYGQLMGFLVHFWEYDFPVGFSIIVAAIIFRYWNTIVPLLDA